MSKPRTSLDIKEPLLESDSERPALAVLPADVGVGLVVVGHFHLLAVPEQRRFGKRTARLPISTISDSGPEKSKFELAGLPSLQARTQSFSWPSWPPGMRSIVAGGPLVLLHLRLRGSAAGCGRSSRT